MFATYKKHNNQLYNNLVKLSRNNFFYNEVLLKDKTETRVLLIFFHFALILHNIKSQNKREETQSIFDNIFQNIEYSFRELGDGDVAVNKKMKNLTKLFYDILVNFDKNDLLLFDDGHYFLKKYFLPDEKKEMVNIKKLADYFNKFKDFCFDLNVKNMLNGSFNFIYK